jgi:RimJ/RimL family protein N-acetyltransferase
MSTKITFASKDLIPSFYKCLGAVAQEKIYIEMTEPPPLERVTKFQSELIDKSGPIFYAVQNQTVVGWCDVFPFDGPRQSHRGGLGMGLLASHRGQGLGAQLLRSTLDRAKLFGLEKVELQVYTTNTAAIALYEKFAFIREGTIRHYRKLDGKYFDAINMALFL